jgi:MerR family transcriptional regulator, Zn(II)-responsive regulator of zntA
MKSREMLIGEVAEASGTTSKTVRFYEEAGLLPEPGRTANGYRSYGADVLARLDFIRRGRLAGLTLAQIREILNVRDDGEAPCGHVQALLQGRLGELDHQIAELENLRCTVAALVEGASEVDPSSCDEGAVCRYV